MEGLTLNEKKPTVWYKILKIAAAACLCILALAILSVITGIPLFPRHNDHHEPITVSTTSTDEAIELFGDDLLLRQFAEIEGGNGTARYTLIKDEKSALDDRSGWRYLESYNYGDGFACYMNIAFSGTSSYGGEFDGKTDINGITVRYREDSPETVIDYYRKFWAYFERNGYKYLFSYTCKDASDNYDAAWQALYSLLEE